MVGINMQGVRMHFGHLCTVQIMRLDIRDSLADCSETEQHAVVEFLIRANKTRATCSYVVQVPCTKGCETSDVAQKAWEDLTGLRHLDAGHIDRHVSSTQQTTLDELKRFVCTETAKTNVWLPLTVV